MTPSQQSIFQAMPPGRWLRVCEVQRHAAKAGRMVWPQRNLSVILGLIAQRGYIERQTVDGREPIYRRAGGAA